MRRELKFFAGVAIGIGIGAATGNVGIGIGIGIAFVAWGAPYLPAPNVGVLVLIESVLAPIWVWLFLDMPMKYQEIKGGIIIFCAVLILSTSKK